MSNSGHPNDQGQRRGLMLVISSPSGAGKTTLARKLMEEFSDITRSVSATTREPRPGEKNGIDYHFKSREDFREMIATEVPRQPRSFTKCNRGDRKAQKQRARERKRNADSS